MTAAAALGVPLSEEQTDRLVAYERLLLDRAVPLGLIAEGDASRVRTRHVLDSLRAAVAVRPGDRDAYDLGSGAGLPGVVVAVARPALSVILVETLRRRGAFLELVAEELGLANVSVVTGRLKRLSEPVDLCFARALASLERSWEISRLLLRPRGRLVYFGGRGLRDPGPLPGASSVEVVRTSMLESSGPLVIMARL